MATFPSSKPMILVLSLEIESNPFNDRRGRLPEADAHRDQAVPPLAPLELVHDRRDQARARSAERMPERDRAAVDVELALIGAGFLEPCQRDRREGLVDLEQIDVLDRKARFLEHL